MKNTTLILFIFIYISGLAQKEKPVCSISNGMMNILYSGVSNFLLIAVEGYTGKDLDVKIRPHGRIEKEENGQYIVNVTNKRNVYIDVYAKGKKIRTKEYRIIPYGKPTSYCGNVTRFGYMAKEELLGQVVYAILLDHFGLNSILFNLRLRVESFTLSTYKNGVKTSIRNKESNMFNQEQQKLIRQLNKGDYVVIHDIKAFIGTSYNIIDLDPIIINIGKPEIQFVNVNNDSIKYQIEIANEEAEIDFHSSCKNSIEKQFEILNEELIKHTDSFRACNIHKFHLKQIDCFCSDLDYEISSIPEIKEQIENDSSVLHKSKSISNRNHKWVNSIMKSKKIQSLLLSIEKAEEDIVYIEFLNHFVYKQENLEYDKDNTDFLIVSKDAYKNKEN